MERDRRARTCQEEEEEEEEECGEEDVKWRRSDGECNNLERRLEGSSHSPYRRLLAPTYSDSSLSFRRSLTGLELPSARETVPASTL